MQLVKSLSALALLGTAIPSTYALSIKDDTVSLSPGIRIQTRATVADASSATGDDYRLQGGVVGGENDPIDFSIRRARLYMGGKYGQDWKFLIAFNADNIDSAGTASASRAMQWRYAWVERQFTMGDDFAHIIHFGLDKPYNNPSDGAMSSSRELFPTGNAAAGLLAPRGVGIGYRLRGPLFLVAADVQNNITTHATTGLGAVEEEGLYYGARAEFSFSKEWFIAKRAESFLGKEGTGLNLGASWATNSEGVTATDAVDTMAYGVDLMFHWNNISAYAEYRTSNAESTPFAGGAATEQDAEVILGQVGYAFPLANGHVIEPAVRYQIIDGNTETDETSVYGTGEVGGSGNQIDVGLNYYLDGHNNKFQLAYQMWEAEEGDGDANIVRLQHQLNF